MNRFSLSALALGLVFFIVPPPPDGARPAAAQAARLPLAAFAQEAPQRASLLPPVTVGDSHCLEIARLMGWKTRAKNGALTEAVPSQLTRVPRGSQVIVCAGTNDSNPNYREDPVPHLDAALDVALLRGLHIVWFGPSYIEWQSWRMKAAILDQRFAAAFAGTPFTYISINHTRDPVQHRKDAVHLQSQSYRELARLALEYF